eukprot:4383564-Alexandrium_andersonii.AAC.1
MSSGAHRSESRPLSAWLPASSDATACPPAPRMWCAAPCKRTCPDNRRAPSQTAGSCGVGAQ